MRTLIPLFIFPSLYELLVSGQFRSFPRPHRRLIAIVIGKRGLLYLANDPKSGHHLRSSYGIDCA